MKEKFVCKSKRLAGFLVSHGCNCIRVDQDNINPNYMVFIFEKTEKWNQVMQEWQLQQKKGYGGYDGKTMCEKDKSRIS